MRKALLSGLLASAAVLAVAAPAYALLVSDTFVFSNQTTETWTLAYSTQTGTPYSLVTGTPTLAAGGTKYSTLTATDGVPITFSIRWESLVDGTACTYSGSQSKNAYGNWQTTVTKASSGPRGGTVKCNFTPPGTGSTKFNLNYGVSF